ncbi:hypothetical protein [Endozoicomonas sp. SESOKO1]|uniref:hypothetical protein n=1 Tax=Endozoicomonas sp. SESOKO1 TaxID=2828742 RepID=UPI0021490B56|nr:hypothetical protein [Endozoicomonas sp. SESOKO1]
MDKIALPYHDYSSLTERQLNDLTPAPKRRNSICLGELSSIREGANCTGKSDVGNIAIPDRTIKKLDCQAIPNTDSAPKTTIESEEASVLPNPDNDPLSTQPALSRSPSPVLTEDHLHYLSCFNFYMLQQQKPAPQQQKSNPKKLKSNPKKQKPDPQQQKSITLKQKSISQEQKPTPPQQQKSTQSDMTKREEQEVKKPLEHVTSAASPSPTPKQIHSHNNVSLIKNAGIQAKNNNCSLASFFMAISNNKLLNTLIDEIQAGTDKQPMEGKKQQADSLGDFLSICRNFFFDEETNGYIADEGLDRMRTLFQLDKGTLCTSLAVTDIVKAILNNIYDYPEPESDPSGKFHNLKDTQSSLRHKISWIDAANGFLPINESKETVNSLMDHRIPKLSIPEGLIKEEKPQGPPPPNPSEFFETYSEYRQGEALAIKCTDTYKSCTGKLAKKKFEYFGDMVNKSRTMEAEVEDHYRWGNFARSANASFINKKGQQIFVNHVLGGFDRDEPESGTITTTTSRMATTVEELIKISLNGTKDQLHLDDSAFKQLLPDENHYPEVLFVTIPNFGTKLRPNLEWWKDAEIPTADGKKMTYEASALISIEIGHFLAWNIEGNVLNYADSMGHSENNETVPLVVKMPLTGTQTALQAAENDSESKFDAYGSAIRRIANLGKTAELFILKKKETPS